MKPPLQILDERIKSYDGRPVLLDHLALVGKLPEQGTNVAHASSKLDENFEPIFSALSTLRGKNEKKVYDERQLSLIRLTSKN